VIRTKTQTKISRIDHIQIAAPPGCEAAAQEFYGVLLGMEAIEKPEALRDRGGCWFACADQQVHIGVEQGFRPSRKAHPAFAVRAVDELRSLLMSKGVPVVDDHSLQGRRRFYADDPWGNRLEFVEVAM
jgi:catechol 2,3-dioxygenase-like lactoylglutathione lyase family enzyme